MLSAKETYNNFFKKYGPDVHSDPVRFSKIASLCRGSVLDIACGTGTLSDFYKGDYSGVDISEVAIEYAHQLRREDATFYIGDATIKYPYELAKFDTIVLAEFLEHIDDDNVLFDNVFELSKENTRLIISVPNGDRVPDETHLRQFTMPELRERFRKFGKVKFYNWPGVEHRLLMTVDLRQKNDELISLAIIAKNEGLGLETAILSAIDFVDNIVVAVDDSSTDNTLDIAKRYADEVKTYKWEGSFCKARNLVQENIKTKWVLALDGHEFVKDKGDLFKALDTNVDGINVNITLENKFTFAFPRIIRNYIKWDLDVHNKPVLKTYITLHNFIIEHDREHLQSVSSKEIRNKQRNEMVIGIFNADLKKNKKDPRPWFYLGQHYFYEHDYKKSLKCYKKFLKYAKNKQERWLIRWQLSVLYNLLGRNVRALMSLYRAEKELPNRWETRFTLGIAWSIIGHAKESVKCFVESMQPNKENYLYTPLARDEAQTWDFIGMDFFALGDYHEAKVAWNRALELEKQKEKQDVLSVRIEILKRLIAD